MSQEELRKKLQQIVESIEGIEPVAVDKFNSDQWKVGNANLKREDESLSSLNVGIQANKYTVGIDGRKKGDILNFLKERFELNNKNNQNESYAVPPEKIEEVVKYYAGIKINMEVKVQVGKFVQNHLDNIVGYLENNTKHIKELTDIDYSNSTFLLNSTKYPFMSVNKDDFQNGDRTRCWVNPKTIKGQEYYFNAQWGNVNLGEKRGKAFLAYLIEKDILLEEYKNKNIKFIVGSEMHEEVEAISEESKNQTNLPLNQILYGPPGTGKTYSTVSGALEILNDGDNNIKSIGQLKEEYGSQVEFITFHQSFSYEDFVEGLKAKTDSDGQLTYEVENGVFKQICEKAKTSGEPHILIIDEINRGNISRIFGELITLIEASKRVGTPEEISVQLPYSKQAFSVPNNLYIIGTMNTADRSLTMIDTALRRRFNFIEMMPNVGLVSDSCDGIDLQKMLKAINSRIEVLYDREHAIGHAFLMSVNNLADLQATFKNKILPLLEEYFYNDWQKIKLILADKNDDFYTKISQDEDLFLGMEYDYNSDDIYQRNTSVLTKEAFIQIYKNQENSEA